MGTVFAQGAPPKVGAKALVQPKPKAPMGCKFVGAVRGTKLWAGDCVGSELTGQPSSFGVPGKIDAMTDEELADLHRVLATYHRGRAKHAAIGVVRQYHLDLAQRLADEASQIPRRSAIVERFRGRERQQRVE
jgi:hypothetical protein